MAALPSALDLKLPLNAATMQPLLPRRTQCTAASLSGGAALDMGGGVLAPVLYLAAPLAAKLSGIKVPLLFWRCRGSLADTADSATLVSTAILGAASAPTLSFDSRRKKANSGEISALGEIAARRAAAAFGAASITLSAPVELPPSLKAECFLRRRPLAPMLLFLCGGVSATAVALSRSTCSLSREGESSFETKSFMAASSCSATSAIIAPTCSPMTSSIKTPTSSWASREPLP